MNMGDVIRMNRMNCGLTQEELGKKLVPQVQKSAVAKWENGRVDNIKRSHIVQMSRLFGISPEDLLCFSDSEAVMVTRSEQNLLSSFRQLDGEDQAKVMERIAVFLESDKYAKKGKVVG